jgi:hypothetical protein
VCVPGEALPCVATTLQVARDEVLLWTVAGAKDLSFLQALGSPGS